ncbi:MAG: 2-haloacrylate reductase [Gammaproteobacteria bacterium]|jgi:NADPH2:quinone reductase|nr:2-haloacrylate reductase [Gammaproteobacteria bacterium]
MEAQVITNFGDANSFKTVVFMLLPLLDNLQRDRHGAILSQIAKIVDEGHLKPLIYPQKFSFEDVGHAHALLESGKMFGKVVLSRG